mmetsp:Transcript_266/g.899  ORF Transcript_266/g.899 Transcript_266/m.899 type:complete len:206 (+) Transcript_266:786-1403(+)
MVNLVIIEHTPDSKEVNSTTNRSIGLAVVPCRTVLISVRPPKGFNNFELRRLDISCWLGCFGSAPSLWRFRWHDTRFGWQGCVLCIHSLSGVLTQLGGGHFSLLRWAFRSGRFCIRRSCSFLSCSTYRRLAPVSLQSPLAFVLSFFQGLLRIDALELLPLLLKFGTFMLLRLQTLAKVGSPSFRPLQAHLLLPELLLCQPRLLSS